MALLLLLSHFSSVKKSVYQCSGMQEMQVIFNFKNTFLKNLSINSHRNIFEYFKLQWEGIQCFKGISPAKFFYQIEHFDLLQECTKCYLIQPQRKKVVIKFKIQNTSSIYLKILLSSCTGIGNLYLLYWEFSYCNLFFFLWKKGIMRELKMSKEWDLLISHVFSSSASNSASKLPLSIWSAMLALWPGLQCNYLHGKNEISIGRTMLRVSDQPTPRLSWN